MEQHDVVIVGGGNAGVSLAAKLVRDGTREVTLVESEPVHRYRPLLNYVGGGQAAMRSLERPAVDVAPEGCTWLQDAVVAMDAATPSVSTGSGRHLQCRTLVVCTGLVEDWDAVPGLAAAYRMGWAGSTFLADSAPRVWPALQGVHRGRVVFTVPPEPAPCGATALKPLFMACDHWRRRGVLPDIEVVLVLPGPSPVGVSSADDVLDSSLRSYGVRVLREAEVVAVGHRSVTVHTRANDVHVEDLAFAHVVPPYRAPDLVVRSDLAGDHPAGLVDVDPLTMRHRRHPDVWSLGDVADLGTRPSGGALRKQVAVLAHNLATDDGSLQHYDGYTVMPITVSRRRLLLLEVDRDGRRTPSVRFPDLVRPRLTTWAVDRYLLPVTYFRRILRGKV